MKVGVPPTKVPSTGDPAVAVQVNVLVYVQGVGGGMKQVTHLRSQPGTPPLKTHVPVAGPAVITVPKGTISGGPKSVPHSGRGSGGGITGAAQVQRRPVPSGSMFNDGALRTKR